MSLWENCGSSAGLLRFLLKLSGIGNVADGFSPEWCVHNAASHTHTHTHTCACTHMHTEPFTHVQTNANVYLRKHFSKLQWHRSSHERKKHTGRYRRIWANVFFFNTKKCLIVSSFRVSSRGTTAPNAKRRRSGPVRPLLSLMHVCIVQNMVVCRVFSNPPLASQIS